MGQHAHVFQTTIKLDVAADYLLYLPEDYATSPRRWPLLLFLHGAGERGADIAQVAVHGPPKLIQEEQRSFPFVVVSPQCPQEGWWASPLQLDTLDALLSDIVSRYRIDPDRVYLTGLSMGGFGTWALAAKYPDRFAAIAPICGGGDPAQAGVLAHLPIWVFHGAKDPVVPIARSQEMVDALTAVGADVRFTVYPEAEHDSWTATYENPELYDWFLEHTRSRPARP